MINYKDNITKLAVTLIASYLLISIAFFINTTVSLISIKETISGMQVMQSTQSAEILEAKIKAIRTHISILALQKDNNELNRVIIKAREDCVKFEKDLAVLKSK